VLREPGWRVVLPPAAEESGGAELAPLAPGRDEVDGVVVATREAELEADQTRPPPRVTEARLLSLMENAGQQVEDEDFAAMLHEKGIGTPATRADIIENLIAKGYVVRVDKALRPTVKGIRLIDTLNRIHIDRLTSPELTGEIEYHLLQVEHGERTADDFMGEITDYAREIVERAKTFEYDELYASEEPLGPCPACGRPVVEMAWFYRCEERPGVAREDDCPMRFWKDTSGRYLDRETVKTLLREGKAGPIDGFTARNGRTYRGAIEIDRDAWQLKVRSLGYDEGAVSDQPEYEVNPEPLARCPFDEECQVLESPTQFLCERVLKQEERPGADAPGGCGFVLPRTVCKREITRDEAQVYLRTGKTDLLTDFTSRFGRPFAATLVLKKNGRHGFEFQPREAGARARSGGTGADAQTGALAEASGRKTTRKKAGGKKTGRKQAGRKQQAAGRKKSPTRKKSGASGARSRKSVPPS
jgi:DNA topoisomerase-3